MRSVGVELGVGLFGQHVGGAFGELGDVEIAWVIEALKAVPDGYGAVDFNPRRPEFVANAGHSGDLRNKCASVLRRPLGRIDHEVRGCHFCGFHPQPELLAQCCFQGRARLVVPSQREIVKPCEVTAIHARAAITK